MPPKPIKKITKKTNAGTKSWLDDQPSAQKAARETMLRNPGGRPLGAERFAFLLSTGTGRVDMRTRCRPGRKALVSIPQAVLDDLMEASNAKNYSAALIGLSSWAIRELRRRKRDLVIVDADA